MDIFNQNGVQVLPWPAFSPDLNPIEHLWDQRGKRVYSRRHPPINRQQLSVALQEESDNITQDQIQRLIRSMRRRCQATLDANAGHTLGRDAHIYKDTIFLNFNVFDMSKRFYIDIMKFKLLVLNTYSNPISLQVGFNKGFSFKLLGVH